VSIETHLNSLIKVLRLLIEFVSRVIKKICKIFESQFSFLIFFFFVNVAGEILAANFDKKKNKFTSIYFSKFKIWSILNIYKNLNSLYVSHISYNFVSLNSRKNLTK
jgi:hypothetical protein